MTIAQDNVFYLYLDEDSESEYNNKYRDSIRHKDLESEKNKLERVFIIEYLLDYYL